jgi:hypothetical protein
MSTPAWGLWLDSQWGPGFEGPDLCSIAAAASNLVVGTNPPYTVQDFLAFYPKFGGTPLVLAGSGSTLGSPILAIPASSQISVGQLVSGNGIPDGAFVASIQGPTQITLSAPATATGTFPLTVWIALGVPLAVLAAFVALASASLVQARWMEQWSFAMALFVAHFATLYLRSDGNPNSTTGAIASQGLSLGIQTAKAAGDVSVSYQPVTGLDEFGAWNLTVYGTQLAQFAKIIGSGPMLVY